MHSNREKGIGKVERGQEVRKIDERRNIVQAIHFKMDLLNIVIEVREVKNKTIVPGLFGNFKYAGHILVRADNNNSNSALVKIFKEKRTNNRSRVRRVRGRNRRSRGGGEGLNCSM